MKKIAFIIIIQIIIIIPITIFSQGSWKILGDKSNARGKTIMNIEVDDFGNVWFLSSIDEYQKSGKLSQYTSSGNWTYFKNNKKVHNSKFYAFYRDNNGRIIAWKKRGLFNFQLYCHDGDSWKYFETTIERYNLDRYGIHEDEKIMYVTQDSVNGIWLETERGLILCKDNSFKRYYNDKIFSVKTTNFFNQGYIIKDNSIYKFDGDEFVNIRNCVNNESINFGNIDNNNRAWFHMQSDNQNYISYYDNDSWKDFKYTENSKPTFYFRPDGTAWIKGDRYIGYINSDTLIELPFEYHKIPPDMIYSKVVFDDNDNVYISRNYPKSEVGWTEFKNQGALIHFDGKQIDYPLKSLLLERRNSHIKDMLIDKQNNLWLITGSEKISRLYNRSTAVIQVTADSINIFDKSEGITGMVLNNLIEDSQGRIWVGSSNKGFFMYKYDN